MRLLISYFIGVIFGVGIALSGMINPAKVLNFFDVAGHWDPSLAFVMAGALAVTFVGYRLAFGRGGPLLAERFHLPTRNDIDLRLVGGSAVFGTGWGIAGFCPGAALPALGTGMIEVMIFVSSLLVGLVAATLLKRGRAAATATGT